ncbi:chromosome segregation protein SMC [Stenomitos frigidus]|uniref:Chromosome partition protein Smc n=1 Tax=Stenomitos frigidus ULC18 TaxID=2107698 RepID=A0A2T1DUI4_9CYAN|nr:chromosome segregation protein SMC [Stenomitos frigidus]PSB24155.1 chromosome segregation protein SMC [Stenomitos frigidus ULC18]
MYIKRLELSNFKSFGGTTPIPLLPGFTVVSGPNGSGKSNLLDALLFCLGLAGSKGMRAERLPDLVNHTQSTRGRSTVEASVTVTFDLSDEPELLEDTIERQVNSDGSMRQEDALEDVQNGNGHLNGHSDSNHSENGHLENGHSENGQNGKVTRSIRTEWSVTRKLRVTQQGTYTSNYYINSEPCTLTELHEELNRLRVYPEGYNVVLQGDVTRIISMNARERREIIDELAGVATFDRKINQAKEKLDAVKDREDRYHIVEKELIDQRDRLAQDRIKAEKYKKLRHELQTKAQWEIVIRYQESFQSAQRLREQLDGGDREHADLTIRLGTLTTAIQQATAELEQLNARVRALGEDEQLALQSTLATREAELRQLQRQEQDLQTSSRDVAAKLAQTQQELQEHLQAIETLTQEQTAEAQLIAARQQERDQAKQTLERSREAASASAASAEAWVQEQTALHHSIETLIDALEPQRTEQAQLQERTRQLERQLQEQTQSLETLQHRLTDRQAQKADVETRLIAAQEQIQAIAQSLVSAEQELQIQQETQTRLLHEQREKQRRLDKLEAQTQAIQEAQGTHATQVILQMGLTGVCGLVAQLGRVDSRYQLALETAAGARLGNLVVEDDAIAAAGIEILKQKRAGRATFLPLNKIQAGRTPSGSGVRSLSGCVDYAINLVEFDDRYRNVFAHVFGTTVVFETLSAARRQMGQHRIVTLDGELLETSGAMTGGSSSQRQSIHFGTVEATESAEVTALRDRLQEIDRILERCDHAMQRATQLTKERTQALAEARQQHREAQLQTQQLDTEHQTLTAALTQVQTQMAQNTQELAIAQTRLQALEAEIPAQEHELQTLRQTLADLEQSQTHSEWQHIQTTLRAQEAELSQRELAVRSLEQRLQDLENQRQRSQEKVQQAQERLQEYRTQQTTQMKQQLAVSGQQSALQAQIGETQAALAALEQRLGLEKQTRDRAERQLREQQTQQQQLTWQQQKLQETQQARREELTALQVQLEAQQPELPDPLPEIPETATRDVVELQHELRSLQKRLQAMEPVNMLALEEYDRTQARLEELTEKLRTLQEERTELLLRIENFTTLRQRAFKEAFDAVNLNFQSTFATLSDGDGHLQLEDPHDPFNGGLNLVAHPKGKPVQRLASMSGGEKSLTALSFIFALQRYRPSPFYAFDEVDMFLDGANVERLARMIKQQAQEAQFLVVSLRRPMIESADRTIGVTQARGAYTQVLGINLLPQSASV